MCGSVCTAKDGCSCCNRRADYFERLDQLHAKLDHSRRMLEEARTIGASMATIELWQRIVKQDQAEIMAHRDNRTTQQSLECV